MTLTIVPINAEICTNDLSVRENFSFNDNNYENLTCQEKFEKKLEATGVSTDYYDLLSRVSLEKISEAKSISTISSYYIETEDGKELLQTKKDKYLEVVKEEKERIKNVEMQTAEIRKAQTTGRALSDVLFASPGNTATINKGTLNMVIFLYSEDGTNFTSLGIFQWETMPSARHKDAFGLTRDSTTSVIPQSAIAEYSKTYIISYFSDSNYIVSEHEDIVELYFNDLEASSTGYAFDFELGIDSSSNTYPYYSVRYKEMIGVLSYDGIVNNQNISTVNHWATYAHKRLRLLFNGIDFSIPFGAGFSITWGWSYNQLIEEHIWRR